MSIAEKRLADLEAVDAIKRLKAQYAFHADAKYDDDHNPLPKEARYEAAWAQACCFTENAEWDAGQFGQLKGRQALFESFRDKPWRFALHQFANPIIEVDGDSGTGTWSMWMMATEAATTRCVHLAGYTFDHYRRIDGTWLIHQIKVTQKFLAAFNEPWTTEQGAASFKLSS